MLRVRRALHQFGGIAMAKRAAASKPPVKKRVAFTLQAPQATTVMVTGSFCDWLANGYALKKDRHGLWKVTIWLSPGRHEYRFRVDGEWWDDPACAERVPNPFGTQNCVRAV